MARTPPLTPPAQRAALRGAALTLPPAPLTPPSELLYERLGLGEDQGERYIASLAAPWPTLQRQGSTRAARKRELALQQQQQQQREE